MNAKSLVQPLYDRFVRPRLPRKLAACDDVLVRRVKLFDATDHWPDYERELLSAIREHVDAGETVVDVGGGFGVAAVVAARQVGEAGHVTTYEAAEEQVAQIHETLRLNKVGNRVDVEHALVGPDLDVWGSPVGAATVLVSDLPAADVWILDAEGAEGTIVDVLPDWPTQPGVVIVEIHPDKIGYSDLTAPADFRERFEDVGYEVTIREEVGDKNVYILTADQGDP